MSERKYVEYVVLDCDGNDYLAIEVGEHWTDETARQEAACDLRRYEELCLVKGSVIKRTITEEAVDV